jgi:hypothetical protein
MSSTTYQVGQNVGDYVYSGNVDCQEGDDVGLEEKRKGRQAEAHICPI